MPQTGEQDGPGLEDPDRLQALLLTELLDSPVEEAFDRFTRMVTKALGVPVALVSLIDDRRQFFKSAIGLPSPWAALRGTALSHSFCQHVVTADAPLVISDARLDPRLCGNAAIQDLSVVAYAGAPVHGPRGEPIGALCAIDAAPRAWSDDDVRLLCDLAATASEVISLRTSGLQRRAAVHDLSHQLRSGLSALGIEAEELLATADDGGARVQAAQLVRALQDQSARFTDRLREVERPPTGHEARVDLRAALADAVARSGPPPGREVVLTAADPGASARVSDTALCGVLDEMLALLLAHGRGRITVDVVADEAAVRVRAQDEGDGLPPEVVRDLSVRKDGGAGAASLAERAVRALGGRLVLTSSRPTTLELLLPRA